MNQRAISAGLNAIRRRPLIFPIWELYTLGLIHILLLKSHIYLELKYSQIFAEWTVMIYSSSFPLLCVCHVIFYFVLQPQHWPSELLAWNAVCTALELNLGTNMIFMLQQGFLRSTFVVLIRCHSAIAIIRLVIAFSVFLITLPEPTTRKGKVKFAGA